MAPILSRLVGNIGGGSVGGTRRRSSSFRLVVSFTTVGIQTYTVPSSASSAIFNVWGAGGTGSGECVGSNGGSGGYVQGSISVTSGQQITIFVGQNGGPTAYGAGGGGQYSYVKSGSELGIAGGGGGAGQSGSGGGGGGNGSGDPGLTNSPGTQGSGATQSAGGSGGGGNAPGGTGSFWNNGSTTSNGGGGGGSSSGVSNRGGGGGSGYYGGGGGGGNNSPASCTGGGGGGGSGIISGSVSSTVSYTGNPGATNSGGAVNTGNPIYIPGYGGANQDGLIVLTFT